MGSSALGRARCLACTLPTPSPELKGLPRGAVHREKKVALAPQTLETHEAKLIVSPETSCWRKGCESEIPSLMWEAARRGSFLGPPHMLTLLFPFLIKVTQLFVKTATH